MERTARKKEQAKRRQQKRRQQKLDDNATTADAGRMKTKRAKMSEEENEAARSANAGQKKSKYTEMSEEERQAARTANAGQNKSKRAEMSEGEKEAARSANAGQKKSKYTEMSEEERQAVRTANAGQKKSKYTEMGEEERQAVRTANAGQNKSKRGNMTEGEKEAARTADAEDKRKTRESDSKTQRVTRETKLIDIPDFPNFANKHKDVETAQMFLLCSNGSSTRFPEAETLVGLDPKSDEYKKMVERTRVRILAQKPSLEDEQRMQHDFMKELAYGVVSGEDSSNVECGDMLTCACCGTKHNDSQVPFKEVPLDELNVLRISDASKAKFAEILEGTIEVPMNKEGTLGTIELRKVFNWYPIDEPVYWLKPEFVENNAAQICKPCLASIRLENIPQFSLANVQFGSLDRLPDWFVKDLTPMERSLLATVRTHRVVIKIQSNELSYTDGSGSALRGHYILWPHDAPQVTALQFINLESWQSNITLEFVCRDGKLDYLIQQLLGTHMIRGRPHALYQYLAILKFTYPEQYGNISLPPFEDLKKSMTALTESLLENAIVTQDNQKATEEDNIGNDVANVRTSRRNTQTPSQVPESETKPVSDALTVEESNVNMETDIPPSRTSEPDRSQGTLKIPPSRIARPSTKKPPFRPSPPMAVNHDAPAEVDLQYDANRIESIVQGLDEPLIEIVLVGDGTSSQDIVQSNLDALRQIERRIPTYPGTDTSPKGPAVSTTEKFPLNEFLKGEGGDRLLARAHPHIFLCGPQYGRETGTLTERQTKHLLYQNENRISGDKELIAFLFDQKQRHGHISGAAKTLKCYGGDKNVGLRADFFDIEYLKDLKTAMEDPEGKLANRIIREWEPYFKSSGKDVKWGPLGKHEMISQIYALCRRFGAATAFVTFCPDDKNNPNVMRFGMRSISNSQFPAKADGRFFEAMKNDTDLVDGVDIPIPLAYRDRVKVASQNPVASARMYCSLLDAIFTTLLGKSLCQNGGRSTKPNWERKTGLFGDVVAAYGVTENTQRGSLHAHFILWGGLPPTLLTMVAHIPILVEALCSVLESMFVTKIPRALHVARAAGDYIRDHVNTKEVGRRRPSVLVCPLVGSGDFWVHGLKNAACYQYHKHSFTCFKTRMGRCGCRMCYPRYNSDFSDFLQIVPNDFIGGIYAWKVLDSVEDPVVFVTSYDHPIAPQDERALVLELARPMIDPLPDIDANDNARRLILYETLVKAMGDFAEDDLCDYLQSCDLPILEKVYNKVKELLPTANSMIVDFNLVLTGFIGSNTAVYHLGNVVQSNSALFYISPYMSKSNTPPGRVLSVLAKVLEEIHARRLTSCHPDVMNGDQRAQVKDLPLKKQMQRAVGRFLNKVTAITEHHETEMAMCLLGSKTHWSTESFCFFDVKTLLPYLKHCDQHGLPVAIHFDDNTENDSEAAQDLARRISEVVQVGDDDNEGDNDMNDTTALDIGMDDIEFETVDSKDHDDAGGREPTDDPDNAKTNVDQLLDLIEANDDSSHDPYCVDTVLPETFLTSSEDTSIGRMKIHDIPIIDNESTRDDGSASDSDIETRRVYVHDHLHHDLRGVHLRDLSPIEYISMIEIVRYKNLSNPTGRSNSWFHFDSQHPLFGVYVQRLRSKFPIPILTGKPPKFPTKADVPHNAKLHAKFSHDRDVFGGYFVSIFNCDRDCYAFGHERSTEYNWKGFVTMVSSFREGGTVRGVEMLNWVSNTIFALTANNRTKEYLKEFRARNRKLWTVAEKAQQAFDVELQRDGKQASQDQMLDVRKLEEDDLFSNMLKQAFVDKLVSNIHAITGDAEIQYNVADAMKQRAHVPRTLHPDTYYKHCVRSEKGKEDEPTMRDLSARLQDFQPPLSDIKDHKDDHGLLNNIDIDAYKETTTAKGMAIINSNVPTLNQGQRLFLETILAQVVDTMILKRQQQTERLQFETPFHLIGYPGVGKTTTMLTLSRMIDAVGAGVLLSTAFTGVAAALVNGVMFMRTWKIFPSKNRSKLGPTEMSKMRHLVQASKLAVLVVDEFGTIPAFWVKLLELRLRELTGVDKPFGGILVVFTGDHSQMVPKGGPSIAKSMMKYAYACSRTRNKDKESSARRMLEGELWEYQGCQLIESAKTLILDVVVRAKDRDMAEFVVRIAKGGAPTMNDLKDNFKPLTRESILKDPTWLLDATYLVLTNQERMEITSIMVKHYAIAHGLPIVRWLSKLDGDSKRYNIPFADRTEAIHWQYFVPGCRSYLTGTLNPYLKFINGSMVDQESLTMETVAQQKWLQQNLKQAKPGEYITLLGDDVPLSVNVIPTDEDTIKMCKNKDFGLPRSFGFGTQWSKKRKLPVIPILRDQNTSVNPTKATVYIESAKKYVKIELKPRFGVEMRFAMTTDKAQGSTLSKTILTLHKRPVVDIVNYTHPKFLVASSRYETRDDVRVILDKSESGQGYNYEALRYLTKLNQDSDVTAFHAGYETSLHRTECVTWNMEASLQFATAAAIKKIRSNSLPGGKGKRNKTTAPQEKKGQKLKIPPSRTASKADQAFRSTPQEATRKQFKIPPSRTALATERAFSSTAQETAQEQLKISRSHPTREQLNIPDIGTPPAADQRFQLPYAMRPVQSSSDDNEDGESQSSSDDESSDDDDQDLDKKPRAKSLPCGKPLPNAQKPERRICSSEDDSEDDDHDDDDDDDDDLDRKPRAKESVTIDLLLDDSSTDTDSDS
jgi:hypothetical protein